MDDLNISVLGIVEDDIKSLIDTDKKAKLTNQELRFLVLYFNRRIRLTQVTTTYRIRGYGKLPHEFNGF